MVNIAHIQEQIEQEIQARKRAEKILSEKNKEIENIQADLKELNKRFNDAIPDASKEQEMLARFPSENPSPVLRFSFSGKLLFANNAAKQVLNVHPVDTEKHFWIPFLENKQLQKNKFEIEIPVGKDTFLLLFSPQLELDYVNVFGRNITEIKAAQQQLINSETRYRQIVENGNDIFYNINENGYFTYANPTLSHITGYSQAELLKMDLALLVRQDHKEKVIQFYIKQVEERIPSTYFEFPLVIKDGKELWIGQNCSISVQNNGKLELIAVGRDITAKIMADAQLKTTTLQLSVLIDNLLAGVLVEDEYRKIVLINRSFCKLLSVSVNPTSLIGMDGDIVTKQLKGLFKSSDEFIKNITTRVADKKMCISEQLELTDGRVFERDYIPIFSEIGYLGNLWQYRDVTEKRRLQNSILLNEEKYRGIIKNMELGLLEVDKNDIILSANEEFCKIAGYASSVELIGKVATETFLDKESQTIMREQNKLRTGGNTGLYEVKIKKPNGQGYSWVLICGAPLYDHNHTITGSIGIHLDISGQKKIESALAEAKTKAEASSKAKETFLANMSHEIRTPMNAIMGMSELLTGTKLEVKQKQYIDAIRTSANNLLTIINDILDFSKIEAGELTLQNVPFSLKRVVDQAINAVSYKAVEKSVTLHAEIDPKIHDSILGDSIRLNQILLNLISNALKFTQEGFVKLTCTLIEDTTEFNTIEFKVTDTGIGIDSLKLEVIFEIFTHEDDTLSKKYGGSAVGLTICKQLVELMGSEITVESTKGVGSTFRFALKFKKEVDLKSNEHITHTEEKDLSNVRILLVEDNQINQFLATTILRKWKAEVEIAVNGLFAIEFLKKKQVDIILMDIQMPEMGGIEATQKIRNELNIQTPIIAVTANALKGDKESYLEAGMNDYVSKPFEQQTLYTKICQFLDPSVHTKKNTIVQPKEKLMEQESQQLYNLTEIKKIAGGDKDFIKQMISIFLDQIPQSLAQINQAIETKDFERVKSVAHQMKPSIDIMQIDSLKKEVRFVEENAGNQTNLEQLPEFITKLNTVLNSVLTQLKADPEIN
jgi:PAS domain S-box-containing protein